MTKQLQSQWFLRGVLPACGSLVLCSLLLFSLSWAAARSDAVAVLRQRDLVTLTIAKLKAGIAHDQESATVWDDAVRNARAGNIEWIDANLGSWMHSYFGHDAALVLTSDLAPLYQFSADSDYAPTPGDLRGAYLPLAETLQGRLVAGDADGTNEKILSIGETDLSYVGFRPAIVSVKPIVSDTGDVEQTAGSEMLHVVVRFLDGDLPTVIGKEYAFSELQFSATRPRDRSLAFVPLKDRDGEIFGYFEWKPFRPGHHVLEATTPALILAFVALFAGSSLAGGAIWRRTERLAASRAELSHQACHDALTGLANRSHFNDELNRRLQEALDDERHTVLFVDLDRFKAVNDTFGHPIGDKLISLAAERMRDLLPEALIARIGGDEFTVLLQKDYALQVEKLADALVQGLKVPFEIETAHIVIGASIGVAIARGPCDPAELTRQADIALYHAKAAGRNTYAIFGDHMDELLRKRRALESDLRSAVVSGSQIETFYQPVYSASNGRICSLEALARWKHHTLGYISPDEFIPLAEEMGLIREIGSLVLEDACRTLAELPDITVAVNASARELEAPGYALRVLTTLARWNLSPDRLEIEMTESATIDNCGELGRTISTLRTAGVRFAIDDFGTGYSSFSRVQKVEVDRIKIDKSFIDDMHRSDSRALVIAMIDMARAKGLKITAEGVETTEQREALESLGCDDLQGFLMSRPLPREAAIAYVSAATSEAQIVSAV
ncbi:EAL domain-containing protein [Rhizobium wenxiniae]|uniref:putative bifunctional diguanylate cyclase/phosphodiesterase n=1 Tax=Rhizobium wenxiniae TaxID=1737357 RepID=UPI001C6EC85D|nr:bifunctional diguanylate cyclase/phosphodiesterase [Rhizobium wenxiniae]MBW9089705.1 EAL domain-containing protein [Rhizobium wenxiniae]